jgi:hypothetical protein
MCLDMYRKSDEVDVRIGQLWRDNDSRMNGRTLRITGFVYAEGLHSEKLKAICRVGAGPEQYTKISIRRLKTSAFTLIRDENGKRVGGRDAD